MESTILSLVGLQVWRGALLLADFILYHGKTYFNEKDFLELGSGVGLTSVIAGIYAKSVVCTGRELKHVTHMRFKYFLFLIRYQHWWNFKSYSR